MKPMQALTEIDAKTFVKDIVPANQPVVLKGLVAHWPSVSLTDDQSFAEYLHQHDSGERCYAIVGDTHADGRLFYGEGLKGTNFAKTNATVSDALAHIATQNQQPNPRAIAIQAASLKSVLPTMDETHRNPITGDIEATFWLSNQSRVAAHFDLHDNIACVVHGTRTFTVFPPDQISNLYVGPTLDAPGGVPISTVDLKSPDLATYPRFEQALESAQTAQLEPGDAIYIPSPWWHAVSSEAPLNLLVNYWWQAQGDSLLAANQSLMHAMLSVGRLPKQQRAAWQAFFNYLVFKLEDDPTAHLPNDLNDVVTELTDQQTQEVIAYLSQPTLLKGSD